MWLFVNSLIENPTFDSQTKETMTLVAKKFGSKCSMSDKFVKEVSKSAIVENILAFMRAKAQVGGRFCSGFGFNQFPPQTQLNKKLTGTKTSKIKGIPKLEDANDAGTKHASDCTLILTEGDSAKALVVAGFSVIGRDKYGVFPLRGKLLNVRDASHKQIMANAEIQNLTKILGLQFKKKYSTPEEMRTLRYGKLMIMTDQDPDGSHIKGLLINFIHANWPNLVQNRFLQQFITPLVKVTRGNEVKAFYSLPEFDAWKEETADWDKWRIKYYKGLGTSTAKEAKEYFGDMARHNIRFKYRGELDDKWVWRRKWRYAFLHFLFPQLHRNGIRQTTR